MGAPILIRRRVELARLRTKNEVAGFKFATVGVLYAVLLAFAVIVVWEKFSDAETAVAQEAGAAATIYRLANGLDDNTATAARDRLSGYIRILIYQEWPAMEQGGASKAATHALDDLYATVLAYAPTRPSDGALLGEVLRQLDSLTQARRARLVLASGIVPGVIWLVLFGGAFLTIGFTLFFGTENLPAQALMTGILAVRDGSAGRLGIGGAAVEVFPLGLPPFMNCLTFSASSSVRLASADPLPGKPAFVQMSTSSLLSSFSSFASA